MRSAGVVALEDLRGDRPASAVGDDARGHFDARDIVRHIHLEAPDVDMQRIVRRAAGAHDRLHQPRILEGGDDLRLQQRRQIVRPFGAGEIGELVGAGADDDALGIERAVALGSAMASTPRMAPARIFVVGTAARSKLASCSAPQPASISAGRPISARL